jgi:hypothetical protein
MDEEKIREEVYNNLQKEYDDFIENLKSQTPDEIISHSYEKVIKEELISMFYPESDKFDINDIRALRKNKNSLEELYQGWMDADGGIHQILEDSVNDTIDFIKKNQKEKSMER